MLRNTGRNFRAFTAPQSNRKRGRRNAALIPALQPVVEALEKRELLSGSLVTWANASSGAWNSGSSWQGGVVPGTGDTAVFPSASTVVAPVVTAATSIGGIVIDNSGAAYNVAQSGGTQTLTIGSGGISVSSPGNTASDTTTLSPNIALAASQTWTETNNTGTTKLVAAGVVSGSAGLQKAGDGTLVLSSNNTLSGTTTVSSGTLQVGNAGTTGSIAGAITLAGGALIYNRSAAVTLTNNITLTADSTIGAAGQQIVLSGTLNGGAHQVNVNNGAGTHALYLNDTVSNVSQFNVNTGWLGLDFVNYANAAGTNPPIILASGTTLSTSGTGTVTNDITLNGGSGVGGIGTIYNGTAAPTYSGTITLAGGNSLVAAASQRINFTGNLVGSGTLRKSGASAVTLGGDDSGFTGTYDSIGGFTLFNSPASGSAAATWNVTAGGYLADIAGTSTISLGALTGSAGTVGNYLTGSTGTFAVGALGTSNTFGGSLQNYASGAVTALTKVGNGVVTLSGANITYQGATAVSSGQLILSDASGFNSPTTIASGATLSWTGTANVGNNNTADTITINSGGTLENINPSNYTRISGTINVSGSVTINQTSNATSSGTEGFFLDGGLTGTGTVTINAANAGSGVNFRNNNSTFAGSLIVNGIASTTAFAGSGIGVGGGTTGLQNADITLNGTMELLNRGIGWANSTSGAFKMGALSGSGAVVANYSSTTGITTLTLGNTNNNGSFSGTIANGAGDTLNLVKIGSGTQTLGGSAVYTGPTTLSAGTIAVTGSLVSSPLTFSGGNVNVSGGGQIALNGTIWSDADLGAPGSAGSATYDGSNWTVNGGGLASDNTADQMNFLSHGVNGDATIVAQVNSQTNTNALATSGLSLRGSSDAGAQEASIVTRPDGSTDFQWRGTVGGASSDSVSTGSLPGWVKLVRSGNNFSGYSSFDGVTWTQVGTTETIAMPSSALAGLAVTAHDATALSTGVFSNVVLAVAPAVPTIISTLALPNEIDLSWTTVPGAASYNILRSTDGGATYTQIATGITGTTYADTTATNGIPTQYEQTSTAADPGGSGGSGTTGPTSTPSTPTDPDVAGGVWTIVTDSSGAPLISNPSIKSAAGENFGSGDLPAATYRVKYVNGLMSYSSPSRPANTVNAKQLEPGNPAGFYVTGNSDGGSIETDPVAGSTQAFHASGSVGVYLQDNPYTDNGAGPAFTIPGMGATNYYTPTFELERLIPEVGVFTIRPDTAEDGRPAAIVQIVRSGDAFSENSDLSVHFTLGGAAIPSLLSADSYADGIATDGAGYTLDGATAPASLGGEWSATIPAGSNSSVVTATALNDSVVEGKQSIEVSVAAVQNVYAVESGAATTQVTRHDLTASFQVTTPSAPADITNENALIANLNNGDPNIRDQASAALEQLVKQHPDMMPAIRTMAADEEGQPPEVQERLTAIINNTKDYMDGVNAIPNITAGPNQLVVNVPAQTKPFSDVTLVVIPDLIDGEDAVSAPPWANPSAIAHYLDHGATSATVAFTPLKSGTINVRVVMRWLAADGSTVERVERDIAATIVAD